MLVRPSFRRRSRRLLMDSLSLLYLGRGSHVMWLKNQSLHTLHWNYAFYTSHISTLPAVTAKSTIHMHKTPRDKVSWHQNLARDNVVCNFLGMDLMDLMDHEWFAFLKPPSIYLVDVCALSTHCEHVRTLPYFTWTRFGWNKRNRSKSVVKAPET